MKKKRHTHTLIRNPDSGVTKKKAERTNEKVRKQNDIAIEYILFISFFLFYTQIKDMLCHHTPNQDTHSQNVWLSVPNDFFSQSFNFVYISPKFPAQAKSISNRSYEYYYIYILSKRNEKRLLSAHFFYVSWKFSILDGEGGTF